MASELPDSEKPTDELPSDASSQVPGGSTEMFERLYTDLRRFAHAQMRYETRSGIMQPTALVHEAFIKILQAPDAVWQSRAHFFAAIAQTMRRLLIDDARQRNAIKRGGGRQRVPLDMAFSSRPDADRDLLVLEEVLKKLENQDPRLHEVVMLRFFVGLRIEQIADAVGRSPRTVKRDWNDAKEWLNRQLGEADADFEE
ncbi:MAG: ECF-type sigma factor [Planctomycetota bacterium]